MKKIIGTKLYDTDTANCVGSFEYLSSRDPHYFTECLYRKESGEYFLYGKGKPMSRYARLDSSYCWCSGENIYPCVIGEAKEWVLQHMNAETFIEEFGCISE